MRDDKIFTLGREIGNGAVGDPFLNGLHVTMTETMMQLEKLVGSGQIVSQRSEKALDGRCSNGRFIRETDVASGSLWCGVHRKPGRIPCTARSKFLHGKMTQ